MKNGPHAPLAAQGPLPPRGLLFILGRPGDEKGPQLSLRALSAGPKPSGLGKCHAHLALVLAATVAVADLADIVGIALEEQHLGAALAGIDAGG